jgi:hypothetical protein
MKGMRETVSADFRAMSDPELREVAAEAHRRESRVWSRRRLWWKEVRWGAEGELAYRVLAARPKGSAPTSTQRTFLELLLHGERDSHDLARSVDFGDPELCGAARDAIARGWVRGSLAGIGGIFARPPMLYELTPLGLQELEAT